MDYDVFPNVLDYEGPPGMVLMRQLIISAHWKFWEKFRLAVAIRQVVFMTASVAMCSTRPRRLGRDSRMSDFRTEVSMKRKPSCPGLSHCRKAGFLLEARRVGQRKDDHFFAGHGTDVMVHAQRLHASDLVDQ
jgi:hypothetical protein